MEDCAAIHRAPWQCARSEVPHVARQCKSHRLHVAALDRGSTESARQTTDMRSRALAHRIAADSGVQSRRGSFGRRSPGRVAGPRSGPGLPSGLEAADGSTAALESQVPNKLPRYGDAPIAYPSWLVSISGSPYQDISKARACLANLPPPIRKSTTMGRWPAFVGVTTNPREARASFGES
jgi:hypothetical protein